MSLDTQESVDETTCPLCDATGSDVHPLPMHIQNDCPEADSLAEALGP